MSSVHVHLVLNHVSIMAAVFSLFVFAYGFIRKNVSVINVALTGFVVAALAAIPVFLTGESAEEVVEPLPGILESSIEQHEEIASVALWLVVATGVVALAGLVLARKAFFRSNVFYVLLLVIALCGAGTMAYTGYVGGQIRHPEVTTAGGTQNAPAENEGGVQTEQEPEDDD